MKRFSQITGIVLLTLALGLMNVPAGAQLVPIASNAPFTGGTLSTPIDTPGVVTDGFSAGIRTTAVNTTVTATDFTILVDSADAVRTVTLPAASDHPGRIIYVKKIDNAVHAHNIATTGADTIDGGAVLSTATSQWSGRAVQSTGSGWVRLWNL